MLHCPAATNSSGSTSGDTQCIISLFYPTFLVCFKIALFILEMWLVWCNWCGISSELQYATVVQLVYNYNNKQTSDFLLGVISCIVYSVFFLPRVQTVDVEKFLDLTFYCRIIFCKLSFDPV